MLKLHLLASRCGTLCRAVSSDTSGVWFKSSQWQILYLLSAGKGPILKLITYIEDIMKKYATTQRIVY